MYVRTSLCSRYDSSNQGLVLYLINTSSIARYFNIFSYFSFLKTENRLMRSPYCMYIIYAHCYLLR